MTPIAEASPQLSSTSQCVHHCAPINLCYSVLASSTRYPRDQRPNPARAAESKRCEGRASRSGVRRCSEEGTQGLISSRLGTPGKTGCLQRWCSFGNFRQHGFDRSSARHGSLASWALVVKGAKCRWSLIRDLCRVVIT